MFYVVLLVGKSPKASKERTYLGNISLQHKNNQFYCENYILQKEHQDDLHVTSFP